jgi:hypothetical protein
LDLKKIISKHNFFFHLFIETILVQHLKLIFRIGFGFVKKYRFVIKLKNQSNKNKILPWERGALDGFLAILSPCPQISCRDMSFIA